MSISISCPGCGKTLKAKDELAGKRVKCPACGQPVVVPSDSKSSVQKRSPTESLFAALESDDPAAIARSIVRHDFILVETPEDSSGGDRAALTAEVDDYQVLVAFTSTEHAATFGGAMPDILDADGMVPTFVVSGADFLKHLPPDCGVLLNPESENDAVLPPDLVELIKQAGRHLSADEIGSAGHGGRKQNEPAERLREQVFADLEGRGFRPARWLPLPDMTRMLRPVSEIATRLIALAAIFTWVSAPESAVPSDRLRERIKRNRVREWVTADEANLVSLPRRDAHEAHVNAVGWKLENMWPLAWVLGFEAKPTIEASQIDSKIIDAILFEFLNEVETIEALARKSHLRSIEEVIALEDRFYCAHNAVRSAQLGEKTVPNGFDPLAHGGAIHERRHSLTWCLSPGVDWDDTDLST